MPTTGVEARTPTKVQPLTGQANVDALIAGYKYAADSSGGLTTVTFSFPTKDSLFSDLGYRKTYESGYVQDEPDQGVSALSTSEKAIFASAVTNIARFSNLVLTEVPDAGESAGTVRIAYTQKVNAGGAWPEELGGSPGWAFYPAFEAEGDYKDNPISGDIWLNATALELTWAPVGNTIYHELGHALGLKHSFEDTGPSGAAIDTAFEGSDYTLLSYKVSGRFPEATWADLSVQTYMAYDIKAIQALYGKNMSATGVADTYNYDLSSRFYLTIWDAGGTDTLSVSGGDTDVHLSLKPGTWSSVGTEILYSTSEDPENAPDDDFFVDSYTVFITDDTIIENATGAGGSDVLEGNDVANTLIGNGGDDVLTGGAGDDLLRGDAGDDISIGGEGNDALWAGAGDKGNDISIGGAGNDVIGGGAGNDLLVGGGFDEGANKQFSDESENSSLDGMDTLYGADGNDTVLGGGWDDTAVSDNDRFDIGEQVTSGTDDNVIWAGNGNDLVYGAAGHDVIGARDGSDTVYGGGGNDTVYGGSSVHSDQIFGEAGNDLLYAGAGNDTMDGGAGADKIVDGLGDDVYTGGSGTDTFVFAGDKGSDRITDFSLSTDILDLSATVAGFSSVADVKAAATVQGSGLLIDLGGDHSVLLEGVSLDDVGAINFQF